MLLEAVVTVAEIGPGLRSQDRSVAQASRPAQFPDTLLPPRLFPSPVSTRQIGGASRIVDQNTRALEVFVGGSPPPRSMGSPPLRLKPVCKR
jgi:hypothetical protein